MKQLKHGDIVELKDILQGFIDQQKAIQRVQELHKPIQLDKDWGEHCEYCDQDYPCGTIKALDGEQ